MPLFKMENGSVWKNILLDYEHGEKIITPIKYSNKIQCEYERERVHYLINKWSFSQLSQIKELVSTLYTSLSYLKEDPIDSESLLTGVWKGTMNREDIVIKIRVEHGYVILSYDWKSIKEENIRLHYIDYGYKIESDEESLKNKGIKLTLNKDGKMKIKIGKSYSNNLSKIKQK
ncbi:MAG: hypothetical protein MJZ34_03280 [Paludibacteraceae bacterium]|nr:hypothetical protein [Paludibacteraceae bacterium]